MLPDEQTIISRLFIPAERHARPGASPLRVPALLRPGRAEPRGHGDGHWGLSWCSQHHSLRPAFMLCGWGDEARKETEEAEAVQDLQLPQPSRIPERAAVPGSQAGTRPTKPPSLWQRGGAEPGTVPAPPTRPRSRARNSRFSVERGGRVPRGDKCVEAAGSRGAAGAGG